MNTEKELANMTAIYLGLVQYVPVRIFSFHWKSPL